ncbi:phosphotransferase family protein [Pseudonocardia sulfidoxydans]|uniref:phosphotransferase family protein n=1 Tax=Pseudonocardia sulfidoxydans TaxID=54011 RepID=UPI00361A8000
MTTSCSRASCAGCGQADRRVPGGPPQCDGEAARAGRRSQPHPGFALRETSIRSILARNPDSRDIVDRAFWLNRCAASVLVDSDLTPKNVLVHGSEITKLDFECAQWGPPALDVGVVLAHYMLHAVANPAQSGPLLPRQPIALSGTPRRAAVPTSPSSLGGRQTTRRS